ncbi:hypothetical protein [Gaoshiqia sp. Z1-71]|uniref:hypothetical protein n=1 Tax=Gaoshiqia hydrogeniformans TaxID=3290090 RepID=UPI003BF7C1C2
MLRTFLGVLCLLVWVNGLVAQEKAVNNPNLNFYGFIRNEFFVDTYKGLDAAYEVFYLVPLYVGKDANGEDINQQASSYLAALASRLGVKIEGPEIFGAKTSGNIEFDFGGIVKSEPTLFRIRHANMVFSWEKSRLLLGQTWHPFWGGGVFPTVAGLNTGAPFQAFSRAPQIRYDLLAGNFTISATAAYENQYATKALESSNYVSPNQAQRNGVLPELILSAEYRGKGLILGAGALSKRIKPAMTTTGTAGLYKSDEYLTSAGFMAYLAYKTNKLNVTAKGYYGQNMTHLTFLGGYGVASKDESTGAMTYTNFTNYTSLLNIVYGKKWQAGLMLGYGGNLGTADPLYRDEATGKAITAGLLPNVMDMARVAPNLALNISKLRFVAEYEMTTANYGAGSFDFSDGLYSEKHRTTNHRAILMMMYMF